MNTTLKEETLGQRLKAARIRKNMTQEELAEAMLTTKSMISYYENDHGDMKQSMIAEFADVLGTTVEYLICGVIKAPELDADSVELLKLFGAMDEKTKQITIDEMGKMIPAEVVQGIFSQLKAQLQMSNLPSIQMTWRVEGGFFNIRIREGEEPEISTLVLRHGKSVFDFNFSEESDGTKRLFDLIDMLLTERPDTVFVVDELERSLHPKLTEHFLKLFMEAHDGVRMQLVFTTHEDTIMDQSLFRRDEIWFVERDADNASKIYSLDRFKERYDKKLSKAYLEGRYGAIPVFRQFSFRKGE